MSVKEEWEAAMGLFTAEVARQAGCRGNDATRARYVRPWWWRSLWVSGWSWLQGSEAHAVQVGKAMTDEQTPFTVPLTAYLAAVISHDMVRKSSLLDGVQIHVDEQQMTNVIKVDSIGGTYDVTITRAVPE